MADVRRTTLIFILILLGSCRRTASDAVVKEARGLTLAIPNEPGGLSIKNGEARDILISHAISVEYRNSNRWTPLNTEFNAVSSCRTPQQRMSNNRFVRIKAGSTLRVIPWRGYSCSGQCQEVCRANVYFGAGPFRFSVQRLPDKTRAVSAPFRMPADHAS